jgi:hypothetical protein
MYTLLDLYIFTFEVNNLKKELGDFEYKRYWMYVTLLCCNNPQNVLVCCNSPQNVCDISVL